MSKRSSRAREMSIIKGIPGVAAIWLILVLIVGGVSTIADALGDEIVSVIVRTCGFLVGGAIVLCFTEVWGRGSDWGVGKRIVLFIVVFALILVSAPYCTPGSDQWEGGTDPRRFGS